MENKIFNENNIITMSNISDKSISGIITSPPYNISTKRKDTYYNERRLANARFKPLYLMQAYEQNLDAQRMTVKA